MTTYWASDSEPETGRTRRRHQSPSWNVRFGVFLAARQFGFGVRADMTGWLACLAEADPRWIGPFVDSVEAGG